MKTVRLGDVAEVISGATPRTSVSDYWDGNIPWATPADLSRLSGMTIRTTERAITETGLASCAASLLPPGSVLLSSRAPIGYVAINEVPMSTNQGFKSLIPSAALDPRYLAHWLRANTALLQSKGNGATFKELSKRTVQGLMLPLPELNEQRRIADILDKADALRAKRQKVLDNLDALTQSIFHDMFGDPGANPMNWPLKPLGSLAVRFSDGPFGSNLKSSHYENSGVRVVRLQNIGVGRFLDDDKAFISEGHFRRLGKHECGPGDVLIGTLGDPNLRACVLPPGIRRAINKADCVQMRVDSQQATGAWAVGLLNSPGTLLRARSAVRGQTRARLAMGRLRDLEVPVPPLELQRSYSEVSVALEHHRHRAQEAVECLNRLALSLKSVVFERASGVNSD